jgi:hypothetical protein
MDNERAKIVLSAYRFHGADASDPVFAEALVQAERDPELALWFADERALDERMHAAVRSVRPPANLKAALLLAAKMSRTPAPRAWGTRAGWLAAAAAIVLFGGIGFLALLPDSKPFTVASVTAEIGRLKREGRISLGAMVSDPEQIQRWLKEHDGPHDFAVPIGLTSQVPLGCQVLDINGNKVSLVCFRIEGGQIVHLLVMDSRRLADPPAIGKPFLLQEGDLAFATWSTGDRTYVIASRGPAESLRQWL